MKKSEMAFVLPVKGFVENKAGLDLYVWSQVTKILEPTWVRPAEDLNRLKWRGNKVYGIHSVSFMGEVILHCFCTSMHMENQSRRMR